MPLPRPNEGVAEMAVIHEEGDTFRVRLKNKKLNSLLDVRGLLLSEAKAAVACFCAVHEEKFVAHYTPK